MSTLVPTRLVLNQNNPNPFNPSTSISFALPEGGRVALRIYDAQGHLVRTLVDGDLPAANHVYDWDGKDSSGLSVGLGRVPLPPRDGAGRAPEQDGAHEVAPRGEASSAKADLWGACRKASAPQCFGVPRGSCRGPSRAGRGSGQCDKMARSMTASPTSAPIHERQRRVLTAFQTVLGALLAMRRGEDWEQVPPILWRELRGLDFRVDSCGLYLVDPESRDFRYWGWTRGGLIQSRRPVPFANAMAGLPFEVALPKDPGQPATIRRGITAETISAWFAHLNQIGAQVEGFDPAAISPVLDALAAPFAHGALVIARPKGAFTEDETDLVARFAVLIALGYARFLDLQRLDEQNQALRLSQAVDQVQREVGHMERSHDWGRVVRVLNEELLKLGVRFNGCSINVIDEASELFRQYMVVPRFARPWIEQTPAALESELDDERDLWRLDRQIVPGSMPSPDAFQAWKDRRVLIRRMSEEERDRRFHRTFALLGTNPEKHDQYPRSTLDVPFAQGLIALTSPLPDAFTDEEVSVVSEFARLIDSGYRRWLEIRTLEDTNHQLLTAQAQLVQSAKMAAMGELVAGVAHEMNNPLGAAKSTNDVLERIFVRLAPSDPEEMRLVGQGREALKTHRSAVERMSTIVRDLRDFARLDEAEVKDADLHQGIEATLNLLAYELGDRIELVREFSVLPLVRCSPARMNQVFMNLLRNAVRAIPDRGRITIRTAVDGDHVALAFADTGIGIAPEHLARIFDPGFTTKGAAGSSGSGGTVGVGTGLGLPIAARIVEEHGGRITVESTPGRGTTFTVEMPIRLSGRGAS